MRAALRDMPGGVPLDTLLARVRGRRAFLISDWERFMLAPDPLSGLSPAPWRTGASPGEEGWTWRPLQQEYLWVFSRMEAAMQQVFTPFFWLVEIRTLAICLRRLSGGPNRDEGGLGESLLHNGIRKMLRTAPNTAGAVERLAETLGKIDAAFSRLPEIYRFGGIGALEAALYDISLETFRSVQLHPVMRRYLALLIDSRNLVAAAKQVKWQPASPPTLLAGGTLRLSVIEGLFVRRDVAGIVAMAAGLGGHGRVPETGELDVTLLNAQGGILRSMAREQDGVGLMLDYLWRCGIEARNLALLSRLAVAGIDGVSGEVAP